MEVTNLSEPLSHKAAILPCFRMLAKDFVCDVFRSLVQDNLISESLDLIYPIFLS